ncbi:hypothetical protein [Escherichia coli]|uniref:hypothetical protein n=1 Tax=Escherichia coli TaxID=562 RepID=UPI001E30D6ED|nr:hypothetical protein [Escherichia coli]EJA9197180.1 hypothetical protein [Escherichia coli]MCC4746022.1 hypothetical protein [Escherichia coli]
MNKFDKITAQADRLIRSGERKAKQVAKRAADTEQPHRDNGLHSDTSDKVQVIIEREDPPKPDDK